MQPVDFGLPLWATQGPTQVSLLYRIPGGAKDNKVLPYGARDTIGNNCRIPDTSPTSNDNITGTRLRPASPYFEVLLADKLDVLKVQPAVNEIRNSDIRVAMRGMYRRLMLAIKHSDPGSTQL